MLTSTADAILSSNFPFLLQSLANVHNNDYDVPASLIATTVFKFLQDPPRTFNGDNDKPRISHALNLRYSKQNMQTPPSIRSALLLADLLERGHQLARAIQQAGPRATATLDAAKSTVSSISSADLDEEQVAGALLFMTLAPDWQQYDLGVYVAAVREMSFGRVDWQTVVRGFDRNGITVSRDQFLGLLNALLPIAQGDNQFDIQALWGGRWRYPATQLSFVLAFTSLSPSQLDATTIPRLRQAYNPADCEDGPETVVQYIEEARKSNMISLDAVTAMFDLIWDAETPPPPEDIAIAKNVVEANMGLFLCAAVGIPQPRSANQEGIMAKMLIPYLSKQHPDYSFVLHCVWKQDKQWLATRLIETHLEEPIKLPLLLEHAQEHAWLEDLCSMFNGFGMDLAALAHRKGLLDLDQWAEGHLQRGSNELGTAVSKFLVLKTQDEMRTFRGEQPAPRTVSLAMKTVRAMLEILEDHPLERQDEQVLLERQCFQAFPRLINYGEGFDDIIEVNGQDSNALSEGTDAQMQDLYKRMYSAELEVRDIIEALQEYKTSRDPAKQDIFACMIHGLFDEYVCFNEYPLGPLATTAVLFGGIISCNLISGLTLRVARGMVLEAVRDYGPETSMYKFGLQALIHFLNRLQEWPDFCGSLLQIPGLQETEAYGRAEEVVRGHEHESARNIESNGVHGLPSGLDLTNGNIDDFLSPDANIQRFKSIHVEPPLQPERYEEPDEQVQDKVLFVLNNVSEQNLTVKLNDLREALEDKHHQWFASYLVEERAKLQPNYQQLYLDVLRLLGDKTLWTEVLRETYVSVQKMLNAESTMNSATERTHLKNLGSWLGSLTIARDKPIKHKNLSFKDLLIEGYDTQRLLIVIPFTCKVLGQAIKSVVFKPPNPWLMDIIRLLIELYQFAEIKLNQKFDIEILCKDLDIDFKSVEPSTDVRDRTQLEDEMSVPMIPDGIDGFDELTLGGINRSVRNARFSPAAIASSLPDLESLLVFPPSSGSMVNQARLRQIVQSAVQRAILEIIAPVVERSITIATIATTNLIHKDFAMEPDEDRVRHSAQQMVRALSGSLALVTCKEPLRMSMTNYIRVAHVDLPDQALPEGAILMCVNDNLDTACSIVEKQAEDRSMPEIEAHIESEIAQRRRHRAEHPNESYIDPGCSQWARVIPEPYKQAPGGLNQEQIAIYQDFARQSRGPANHVQSASIDSGRQQLPDVLQEAFGAVPNLPTPAEPQAISHQPTSQQHQQQQQQQQQQQARMLPPPTSVAPSHFQVNGYMDSRTVQERLQNLVAELSQVSKDTPEKHLKDLPRGAPAMDIINQINLLLRSTPSNVDSLATNTARSVCVTLYGDTTDTLEIELLVQLLNKVCEISQDTWKQVLMWLAHPDDDRILNVPVTISLLEIGLMELVQVDVTLTKAIHQRKVVALDFLSEILDALLLASHPFALRADFASSLEALGQWLLDDPSLTPAADLIQKLKDAGVPEIVEQGPDERSLIRRHQMQYLFMEWVRICDHPHPTDKMFAAFISQMHQRQLLNSMEDMTLFFRLCIESSVEKFDREELNPAGILLDAYLHVDALAKLVVLLVKFQGEADGAVKASKSEYMGSMLSLITLILNNHHVMRGEHFNQRVFFRLFSSILCEWHDTARQGAEQDKEIVLVFAHNFLTLQPNYFPGFVYGWLTLVSHRIFMPALLKMADDEVCVHTSMRLLLTDTVKGWEPFAKIMEAMLSYVSELLKPLVIAPVAKDLYRGVLRVLLILHHDFPEFLAENHYRLCNIIPSHCTQLRNLVLSAYPSSFPELPDPFTAGLKVDRLDEIRKAPRVAGDIVAPLLRANIKDLVDTSLRSVEIPDENITHIANAAYAPVNKEVGGLHQALNVDSTLLHALVLYIGQSAISAVGQNAGPSFISNSPQASLMVRLAKELHPEARYYFLSAVANQLRYPNSHTHYFSYALLHLFGNDHADQQESDVRQQITRVLLERLIVHRPHPWGLIITLLELLKNQSYMFWDLPFIKAAPEVCNLFYYVLSFCRDFESDLNAQC